ncbi:MAG: response regulator transcription factor [Pseudomonadota bacterium]
MTATNQRILIVDDDPHIRDVVRIAVAGAGFQSHEVANGAQALTHIGREKVDLVGLDIGMPRMDGFECCREIRKTSQVPVLFLTAQDDEVDRVLGFQLGGDDFVSKPFSPRELVLRIKAILARGKPEAQRVIRHGALEMDMARHTCHLGVEPVDLTATEFTLLARLLTHPNQVHDRNHLIETIYGPNSQLSGRTVDSHIRNIRAKAAQLGCKEVVFTVHGVGVRLGACRV